jgi:tRNA(Ile)-lysidine synthase TilS/MesJ
MIQKQRKVRTLFLGIKEWNLYKNVIVFHPFLSFSKSSLIAYCQHHKIPFGIDETNANDNYQRNRIRKKMLTWSATKLKQTYRNILKFNKTHAKKQTQVDNHLLKWFANNFAIKYYLTIPKVLRYYVIYSTLSCNNISRISHNKIQLIDQFITNAKINSQLRLGKKRIIVKAKNNIEFI